MPRPVQRDPRPDLAELSLAELETLLTGRGLPRFRARQIFQWIWQRGAGDFDVMTNLPRALRASLAEDFRIATPAIARHDVSEDGTQKLVLRLQRRPADRVRLHPRHAGTDLLRVHAGRVRDGLRLLPHRQDGPGAPPHGGRDRRPGSRAGRGHRAAGGAVQRRADGHGRAAAQLRRDDEGVAAAERTRRRRLAAEAGHPVHRGPGADAGQAGQRAADAEPGDLRCTPPPRNSAPPSSRPARNTGCTPSSRPAGAFR